VIFTHNIADYLRLARKFPDHRGILLAPQRRFTLSQLFVLLDRVLCEATAEDLAGQMRWLGDWI
jgi:hypothetical protein